MRLLNATVAALALVAVGACSDSPETTVDRDSLSQRQRDSLVGASSLPGARGVRGAREGADSAAARAARLRDAQQP